MEYFKSSLYSRTYQRLIDYVRYQCNENCQFDHVVVDGTFQMRKVGSMQTLGRQLGKAGATDQKLYNTLWLSHVPFCDLVNVLKVEDQLFDQLLASSSSSIHSYSKTKTSCNIPARVRFKFLIKRFFSQRFSRIFYDGLSIYADQVKLKSTITLLDGSSSLQMHAWG